jgi:hypothetical protein
MILLEGECDYHLFAQDGYCTKCDKITCQGGVEPDAEHYKCRDCGGSTVMGVEQAVLAGKIEIVG